MLELAADLAAELRAGRSVAVVTVVGVPASAPRGVGAALALTRDGRVIGSVSGGCVDGDCVMLAASVLADGETGRARFGFTDEDASAHGLACGGSVDVVACLLHPEDPVVSDALDAAVRGGAAGLALALDGPDGARGLPVMSMPLDAWVRDEPAAVLTTSEGEVLLVIQPAPPGLVIVGANAHAEALCRVAAAAGWAVIVCDPWQTLVTPERFPDARVLVADLPHEWLSRLEGIDPHVSAVCVLTHDERIDIPALRTALRHPFAFVGAMGSRATSARRRSLLVDAGVDDQDLGRLHMPLGLDLGGVTPGETAIAMLAEIVQARHAASGAPLRDLERPIHHRPAPSRTRRVTAGAETARC